MEAPISSPTRVSLMSLGCPKNLVDSEVMTGHLARSGLDLVADPSESDVVIVNTCGFVGDAREESINTILGFAEMKQAGAIKGLVVTGCLVELHRPQLMKEIPEVDAFLPLSDYSGVPSIVQNLLGEEANGPCPGGSATTSVETELGEGGGGAPRGAEDDLGRALLTPRHTAYLRLGEGCNHICAFCAIPKIRGKLKSKPIEVLEEEVHGLVALGVKEVTLVAEDSTDWGKDLGLGYGLADLLQRLGQVDGLEWVRVMYAHPATIDDSLIEALASVSNVVPYLDMPIQHGDDAVLRGMRRGTDGARIRGLVGQLRQQIPEIVLRTTILVGFPGETEEAFQRLMRLLKDLSFDRVGCFVWSPEEGTEAMELEGAPDPAVGQERRDEVMRFQRDLMEEANRRAVGTSVEVLVDAVDGVSAVARRAVDALEIDGKVFVTSENLALAPGDLLKVRITGVQGYDLVAVPDV
ncbi:MAG: 30S ribosomal protein S12 methylthiotransferase RimO [Planctomycetota bacterium]|nr:30S ribosomal protein S12 methylthiotransferase RimO [Planctomycetota bacterium]